MGLEAATLAAISTGVSVASGVLGFVQAQSAASAAAKQASVDAENARIRGKIESDRLAKEQQKSRGKARVQAAASGATIQSFDPLFEDMTNEMLLDQALLDYDTKMQMADARYQGKTRASQYKQQGMSSLLAGATGAAGSYGDYLSAQKTSTALSTAKGGAFGGGYTDTASGRINWYKR